MKKLTFYEKPGCISNTRQKRLLTQQGFTLEVRDLLAEPWTPERLRPFFGERPVSDWFNVTAPRIKQGEVKPEALSEAEALAAMVDDPLLIRRPLIDSAVGCMCGFEAHPLLEALGIVLEPAADLQSCAKPDDKEPRCEPPTVSLSTEPGS